LPLILFFKLTIKHLNVTCLFYNRDYRAYREDKRSERLTKTLEYAPLCALCDLGGRKNDMLIPDYCVSDLTFEALMAKSHPFWLSHLRGNVVQCTPLCVSKRFQKSSASEKSFGFSGSYPIKNTEISGR
jgi:hypothetical protein